MSDLMSAFGNEAACERYSKFPLRRRANHSYKPAPSGTDQEGRFAIVTNVGAGCDGTRWRRRTSGVIADGEVVWA